MDHDRWSAAPRAVLRDVVDTARSVAEDRAGIVPILQVGADSIQRRIRLRERNVDQLDVFHNSLVPGLLQTEGYIRAVVHDEPADWADRFVQERQLRQREAAIRAVRFILTEGVFYQGFPDAGMVADQAEHIAAIATGHRYWRVGVIPRICARPNITHNGFDIHDDEQAFIGTTAGNALMRDPRPVRDHVARFADLAELAVYGDEAAGVLRRIAAEFRVLQV